ncbi:unnamed protein product [Phyllotreta striolata]|uniref:Uncharacterized protein n=1 Tax=Phyllotreta striolata TaxID=444603 RepID=A0A9N9TST1_PHYSR|nr:unnamed protein product [Phyllotreta striolata]
MGKIKIKNNGQQLTASVSKAATKGKIVKVKEKLKKRFKINFQADAIKECNLKPDLLKDEVKKKSNTYKSLKLSKQIDNKPIKKKDKLTLKKSLLMKKVDAAKQLKKEEKIKEKRKKISIIGDTNPLHDALPSLESLMENKKKVKFEDSEKTKKKKAIEKASQRKKKNFNNIDFFKRAINDKSFKKNPFEIISNHIQAVVNKERDNASS